jgi:fructose-specific phosphotransferase system component IIB
MIKWKQIGVDCVAVHDVASDIYILMYENDIEERSFIVGNKLVEIRVTDLVEHEREALRLLDGIKEPTQAEIDAELGADEWRAKRCE